MDFQILGPLEVQAGGRKVQLPGRRQRALLAYLLVHANDVVSSDRLLEELWPEPPDGGVGALQTQVSRLRRLVPGRIVTAPRGYLLRVEPGELDLDRFRDRVARARAETDPAAQATILRDAETLWRGKALDGIDAAFAAHEAAVLEELRLAALEDRVEADLAQGRSGELVPELASVVARHPLRERLRAALILALYRAGRQADALEAYRATRRLLHEELGLEPGPALRALELAILRHDPALRAAVAAPKPVHAVAARRRGAFALALVALGTGALGAVAAAAAGRASHA
jgi:DNA-binding SARP family transcriptional activator